MGGGVIAGVSKGDAVIPAGIEDEGGACEGVLFAVLLDDDDACLAASP